MNEDVTFTLLRNVPGIGESKISVLATDSCLSIHERIGKKNHNADTDRVIIVGRDSLEKVHAAIGKWLNKTREIKNVGKSKSN